MKIASSNVVLNGASQYNKKTAVTEENATILSGQRLFLTPSEADKKLASKNADSYSGTVFVSNAGRIMSNKLTQNNSGINEDETATENAETSKDAVPKENIEALAKSGSARKVQKIEIKSPQELRMRLLEALLASMSKRGKNIKMLSLSDEFRKEISIDLSGLNNQNSSSQIQPTAFLSTIKKTTVETLEQERMSFDAQVSVTTADGRSINIDLQLNMSRELYSKTESTEITETMQRLCDPLVINFGAATAGLTDVKFSFDLDCDGKSDQISQLAQGSGFLFHDMYDGEIKDGSQLFGAQSGNGFKDLAKHDSDGNGWIDENDEIFNKLRVWTKDKDGNDSLIALGEIGIGAIYLGYVDTDYSLKSETDLSPNGLNGMIRKTGIFLNEDGTGGTVQHVDLKI